jgi:biopolymer transport protein ExbB/TolQ
VKYIVESFSGPGGVYMWAILLISVFVISIMIERCWYLLLKCKLEKQDFMNQLAKLVSGGQVEQATALTKKSTSPLGRVLYAVLVNFNESEKDIRQAVDEVFLTEGPKINRFTNLLTVGANLATLLGLLGTIIGLILAFDAVANVPAAQKAAALATGISVALATTAFGLMVAIPTLLVHGLLTTKADRIVEEMDEKSAKMMHYIFSRKGK